MPCQRAASVPDIGGCSVAWGPNRGTGEEEAEGVRGA